MGFRGFHGDFMGFYGYTLQWSNMLSENHSPLNEGLKWENHRTKPQNGEFSS